MNWLPTLAGSLSGDVIFENQRFLQDVSTGDYVASDGSHSEQSLTLPIEDAVHFSSELPAPTSVITGDHVMAFIKAYHSARYDEQFGQ